MSGFRHFKKLYFFAQAELKPYFSNLLSYDRFVFIKKSIAPLLYLFLMSLLGEKKRFSFIDSTPLAFCKNKRIHRHKVFKKNAKRGKTSRGCFLALNFILLLPRDSVGSCSHFNVTQVYRL